MTAHKKKKIYIYIYIYILHIELEHGGKLLQKYEFRKMPSKQNERGKNSQCLIIFFFLHFYAFLHWAFFADQVELTKTSPYILIFQVVTQPALHSNTFS